MWKCVSKSNELAVTHLSDEDYKKALTDPIFVRNHICTKVEGEKPPQKPPAPVKEPIEAKK